MKRQRGVSGSGNGVNNNLNPTRVEDVAAVDATMGKKIKKEKVVVEVKEEERKESSTREVGGFSTTTTRSSWDLNWEEHYYMYNMMPWLGIGVVDEQMSWGSTWFPGWDMDFMGDSFTTSLFNDVVWDDDIWNHKKEIPIPLHGKKRLDWD